MNIHALVMALELLYCPKANTSPLNASSILVLSYLPPHIHFKNSFQTTDLPVSNQCCFTPFCIHFLKDAQQLI